MNFAGEAAIGLTRQCKEGIYGDNSKRVEAVIAGLVAGEKIVLPPNGFMFDENHRTLFSPDELPNIHLPFEETVLEYRTPDNPVGLTKTILVCLENQKTPLSPIFIVPVYYMSDKRMWVSGQAAIIIHKEIYDAGKKLPTNLKIEVAIWHTDVSEDEKKVVTEVMGLEALVALEFVSVAQCSNVEYEVIQKAQAKRSGKKNRNKPPLFEYKTVKFFQPRPESQGRDESHGGRAPVRQHLRRGHIRKYKSGLRIWINSMVVGKAENGFVQKDYTMESYHASATG